MSFGKKNSYESLSSNTKKSGNLKKSRSQSFAVSSSHAKSNFRMTVPLTFDLQPIKLSSVPPEKTILQYDISSTPFSIVSPDDYLSLREVISKDINCEVLFSYFVAFTDHFLFYDAQTISKMKGQYQKCVEKLEKQFLLNNEKIQILLSSRNPKIYKEITKSFNILEIQPYIIQYKVLTQILSELNEYLNNRELSLLYEQNQMIECLTSVIDWLSNHKYPIMPIINSIAINALQTSLMTSPEFFNRTAFYGQLDQLTSFLQHRSPLYTVKDANRQFLCKVVDEALAYRKNETSYFPPIPNEQLLFSFFDHPNSPLSIQGLVSNSS